MGEVYIISRCQSFSLKDGQENSSIFHCLLYVAFACVKQDVVHRPLLCVTYSIIMGSIGHGAPLVGVKVPYLPARLIQPVAQLQHCC